MKGPKRVQWGWGKVLWLPEVEANAVRGGDISVKPKPKPQNTMFVTRARGGGWGWEDG